MSTSLLVRSTLPRALAHRAVLRTAAIQGMLQSHYQRDYGLTSGFSTQQLDFEACLRSWWT
jgi:hypothetical protein